MRHIDGERLLQLVRIGVQVAGSQKEFARQVGISAQYLTDILNCRRPVGSCQKMLDWFGLERIVLYRRKDGGTL